VFDTFIEAQTAVPNSLQGEIDTSTDFMKKVEAAASWIPYILVGPPIVTALLVADVVVTKITGKHLF